MDQVEWCEAYRNFDSGAICPKCGVQLVLLVRVVFVNGALQHGLQYLVDYLNLSIGLKIVGCSELVMKTKQRIKFFEDFILKVFSMVRNQLFRNTKT